jgi:hypothetical protein
MRQKENMVWLHNEPNPEAALTRQFLKRETKPSHALGCWYAFLTTFKILKIGTPPLFHHPVHLNEVTKKLKGDATAQNTTHPMPMMEAHMETIWKNFGDESPSECAIMHVALALGQRLPDMEQLALADFTDNYKESMMLCIRRGKTVRHVGHYNIPVKRELDFVQNLLKARRRAEKKKWNFYLTEHNTENELEVVRKTMRAMLRSVGLVHDPTFTTIGGPPKKRYLEVGSVRRGGLQAMAMAGLSLDEVLEFSMHRDLPMLFRYLDYGAKSAVRRIRMSGAIFEMYKHRAVEMTEMG